MEENILEVGEEKIDLNSNEKEFTQESELASPLKNKMYTKEEVELIKKEMSRNAEKGVQKLICENKLLKEALKELGYIAERSERLLELHEEKPDISEIILRDYFEETIDEYIERTGVLDEYKNALDLKKRIEKEALKMTEDKIFQIEKLKFQNKLGMDEEEIRNFEEVLGILKKSVKIKQEDYDTIFENAYLISNNNSSSTSLQNQEILAKTMSVIGGKGSNKTGGIDRQKRIRKDIEEFLKVNNVI